MFLGVLLSLLFCVVNPLVYVPYPFVVFDSLSTSFLIFVESELRVNRERKEERQKRKQVDVLMTFPHVIIIIIMEVMAL